MISEDLVETFDPSVRRAIGSLVARTGFVAIVPIELLVVASVTVIALLVLPWVAAVELLVVVTMLAGRAGEASLGGVRVALK